MTAIAHGDVKQKGCLYLVSTPIGNLGDISARAIDILQSVDAVLCEDTRETKKLFSLLGLKNTLVAYHDHNEEQMKGAVVARLEKGEALALVSDAGTPLVSDPGYRLVQAVREHGLSVTSVPGANALLPAVQLAAYPCHDFYFGGFLPNKSKARQDIFRQVAGLKTLLVFYESPNRLEDALSDAAKILGAETEAAIVRELTKKFEEAKRGTIDALLAGIKDGTITVKGEIVLLFNNRRVEDWSAEKIDALIVAGLEGATPVKELASAIADMTGEKKSDIYQRILAHKK